MLLKVKYGIVLQPDYYAVAVFRDIAQKSISSEISARFVFFYADRPALIEDYVTHIRGEIRVHRLTDRQGACTSCRLYNLLQSRISSAFRRCRKRRSLLRPPLLCSP